MSALADCFGTRYADDKVYETRAQGLKIEKENGLALSGTKIDDELLKNMQDAYALLPGDMEGSYLFEEVYQEKIRPFDDIQFLVNQFLYDSDVDPMTVDAKGLYESRKTQVEATWDKYGLNQEEKDYWENEEKKFPDVYTYEYAKGFDSIIGMRGAYMVCMVVTFLIAICMSQVFTEEHSQKTDQLTLCTKLGKKKLYGAKLFAGCLVSVAASIIMFTIVATCGFAVYGTNGVNALVQVVQPYLSWYSKPLTVGTIAWILFGLLVLSTVLTGIFTMVLSEILHNSVATMAVLVGGLFLSRLVMIPGRFKVPSMLWNYIPINLLKIDQGFMDERLVSILGFHLTSYQIAPILYVILCILFILVGNRVYSRYQVSGR